jgi:hypothetical protein
MSKPLDDEIVALFAAMAAAVASTLKKPKAKGVRRHAKSL